MSFLKFDEMEQLTELDIEELFKSEIIPETPKFVFKKISQPPVPFIVYHQEESIKRSLSTELIQPTTKRFLTNEEIMSTKHFVQGAETVNVREREFHRFLIYIKERGISQNLDNIELDKLSQYLGSYVLERTKEDGGIMDTTTLHAIVFNMAIDSGLNILGRKITNTSLRVAAFHMQENIGIDAVTGRQFSGHVNPGTAATYRRKNKETSNKVGGALVEAFTGSLAIHPENYGKSLTKDLPLN